MKLGKYDEAIEQFKKTLEIDETYYESYIKISECYKNINNFKIAIGYLDKAISREPRSLEAHKIRAICYYSIGKYIESVNDLRVCLDFKNISSIEIADMLKYIAYCYKQLGKTNEALEIYEEALSHDGNNANLKQEYEELQKQVPIFSKLKGVFGKKK